MQLTPRAPLSSRRFVANGNDASTGATQLVELTSRPQSAQPGARRVWNAPPADLFPAVSDTRRPTSAATSVVTADRKRAAIVPIVTSHTAPLADQDTDKSRVQQRGTNAIVSRAPSATADAPTDATRTTPQRKNVISPSQHRRLAESRGATTPESKVTSSTTSGRPLSTTPLQSSNTNTSASVTTAAVPVAGTYKEPPRRVSFLTEAPLTATSSEKHRHSIVAGVKVQPPSHLSNVIRSTTHRVLAATKPHTIASLTSPPITDPRKKSLVTAASAPDSRESRREARKSAFVRTSMARQDVSADDVRPLIEIAYWSPFLEVRRDAAAALASLSRNTANLEVLSGVGTLGALLSMLGSQDDRVDPSIARDCAQALAMLVKLPSVQTKILQAPDGIDCVFALLHANDLTLRRTAFEIVYNLVTVDELRVLVAHREGFAFLLASCSSKDARVRCLAASILHALAACRDNRFLFYHSTHFETLAQLLHDPYMAIDSGFRRELLSFIQLLVTEEDNSQRFVELNLVPTLLLLLDHPKTATTNSSLQLCLVVVAILECLAVHKRNHPALVAANALPRIVQLCFSPARGLLGSAAGRESGNGSDAAVVGLRPSSASAALSSRRAAIVQRTDGAASLTLRAKPKSSSTHNSRNHSSATSDHNALLRPALTVFCEMAKNATNREHVMRSNVVDCIANRHLYASPDKRVRRGVITLLTFLICKERERSERLTSTTTTTPLSLSLIHLDTVKLELAEQPQTSSTSTESVGTEYKHYIELLARGVVQCLFGILEGSDFSMKVDALGAIAQLTEDTHARLTLCKPLLLQSLQVFAFHPLVQTRYNIARTIANFAARPENILKLLDEGVLSILVKYVCPIARNTDVLYEATRAIAAMSMVHAARTKLVESGVLGTLVQFVKATTTAPRVYAHALTAIRNLRHDAAALRIQSIYRGWAVRVQGVAPSSSMFARRPRLNKRPSKQNIDVDNSLATVMERRGTS